MPHQNNQLLARFGPLEMEALRPELRTVTLDHGQVLADTHRPIETTYFPYSGILSFVVALQNGMAIETGMVGRDGEFGAANALDGKVSLNRVIVQVPGLASAINSDRLRTMRIVCRMFGRCSSNTSFSSWRRFSKPLRATLRTMSIRGCASGFCECMSW